MAAPVTRYRYTVSGSTHTFVCPDYVADNSGSTYTYFTSTLKVYRNGILQTVGVHYDLTTTPGSVHFLVSLTSGDIIDIIRDSWDQVNGSEVTFPNTTILNSERHLNKAYHQLYWLIQELANSVSYVLQVAADATRGILTWNAGGYIISNAGTPTENADVATKAYVDGLLSSWVVTSGGYSVSTGEITVTPGDTMITLPQTFKFGLIVLQGIPQSSGSDYTHTEGEATITFDEAIPEGATKLYYMLYNDPT